MTTRTISRTMRTLTAFALLLIARGTSAQTTAYDLTTDVRIPMPDGTRLAADVYVPTTGCPSLVLCTISTSHAFGL